MRALLCASFFVALAGAALAAPARARKARPQPKPVKAAPPAAPPIASMASPTRTRVAGLRKQMEDLQRQMEPVVDQLETLSNSYPLVQDPAPLFLRREALLKQIRPMLSQMTQLEDEFNTVRSNADVGNVAMVVNAFVSGKGLPPDLQSAYFDYNEALDFGRSIRGFRERAGRVMDKENLTYKATLEAVEIHHRWVVGTSLAGGAAAFLLLTLVLLRQRASRTAILVTSATGEQMLVSTATPPEGLPAPATLPPPKEAQAGTVLGSNYRVERVLGRGGMGVVYEATDLTLQRKVAIKRMTDELLKAGQDLELFVNEARLVASLKHPNIVEIYSILREGGLLHLVFEYVEGKPLSAFLEKGQRVTLKSAKSVVRQVSAALDYAHSRKVIHRDLKPSNMMVAHGGAIKVMDFGIAHQAKMTVARMTRTGAWGTPPYMAPEQELGHIGRETDLFALGVCLYEMVTAQLPYTGPNFLAQKRERFYPPATSVVGGLPPGLDTVIARALAPDPKERFHTGAEFTGAVDALPD